MDWVRGLVTYIKVAKHYRVQQCTQSVKHTDIYTCNEMGDYGKSLNCLINKQLNFSTVLPQL